MYALEGGAFICGAAVQWLRDELGIIKRAPDIERLAATVPDAGGVEFVPALTGLGAPHWDPDARGLISGLTRGASAAHLARATLEAMALQNVDILRAMERDLGRRIGELKVDGGAAANNPCCNCRRTIWGGVLCARRSSKRRLPARVSWRAWAWVSGETPTRWPRYGVLIRPSPRGWGLHRDVSGWHRGSRRLTVPKPLAD